MSESFTRTGGKWCKHCQKTNHNTNECWSTHAVDPWEPAPEPQGGWLGVMRGSLASHAKVAAPKDGETSTPKENDRA